MARLDLPERSRCSCDVAVGNPPNRVRGFNSRRTSLLPKDVNARGTHQAKTGRFPRGAIELAAPKFRTCGFGSRRRDAVIARSACHAHPELVPVVIYSCGSELERVGRSISLPAYRYGVSTACPEIRHPGWWARTTNAGSVSFSVSSVASTSW